MSKPNDSLTRTHKLRGLVLAGLSAVAVVAATGLWFGAAAGIASRTADRIAPNDAPPVTTANPRPSGTYQLRCWQYGRLLFDEGPVTLGAEARQGARLVAMDRHGAPLIVTDTGGTTCLARPITTAVPNLALPR